MDSQKGAPKGLKVEVEVDFLLDSLETLDDLRAVFSALEALLLRLQLPLDLRSVCFAAPRPFTAS